MYDSYELMTAVELASKLYHVELMKGHSSGAARARVYVAHRRLFAPIAETFRIGYAPKPAGTKPWLLTKTGNAKLLVEAGLLTEGKDGNLYDPMAGRITFPQVNPAGRYLGFVGRVVGKSEKEKYTATRVTDVFRRSESLFRIDRSMRAIEAKKSVIVVEGMMDAPLLYQIGIHNVVATGTKAMTDAQAQILARYATNMEIMFDHDEKGREGAEEVRRRRGYLFKQVSNLDYPAKFGDPAEWGADQITKAIQLQQAAVGT